MTYPGNAMSIGYGSGATSQSIEMTSESEKSFNWEIEISFKAGAGGGLVTGASVGTTHGAGTVSVTTSGSAYSVEMQALPSIAEEYGYGFNWRMTSFLYEGKYPVVTYLVTSVRQPPMLPQNFAANDEAILKNRTGNNLNHRDLVVIDRDGKEYRTVTDLSVGVYTLGFSPSYMDGAGSTTYWTYTYLGDNYNIDWPAAQFLVTGPVYNVNATTNFATWGKVTVVSPANATTVTAGQTVIFRAEPYVGYEVECWRVDGTDYGNAGVNTFSHTVTWHTSIEVVFREKVNTLTVNAQPSAPTVNGVAVENKIVTDDIYFTNGNPYAAGYEMTFTTEAADGWHFVQWEYIEIGDASRFADAAQYKVTMPDNSVLLNAVFERDTYALTLGEHLTAYDANGNVISELDAIVGDTEITVKAAPGYSVTDDAAWTINDTPLETQPTNGEYTFVLTEDTTVKANVAANSYTVAVNDDITLYAKWIRTYTVSFDVDVTATADGKDISTGDAVDANSQIVFTYTGTDIKHPIWVNTYNGANARLGAGRTFTLDALDDAVMVAVQPGSEVKFDTQADGLKVDTQIILSGTSVTQPTAPTRAGYTFGGWYTSADCKDSDLYNFADAVNDDLTLYAKWTKLLDSDDTPSGDSGNTPSDDNGAESVGIDDESETGRESSATDADDTEDVKKTESENRNTDTKSPLTGEITGTSVWISMLLAVAVVIVIAHLYDRRWKVAQK